MSVLDQERWEQEYEEYIEQTGARDDYLSDAVYEDCDQRLGGHDNPYQED